MDISPVTPNGPQKLPQQGNGAQEGPDFKELMDNYLQEVNSLQEEADKAVLDLAAGRKDNLHQVVAALNEADLSFRLMMEVRNKLMDAYREIMRMQV
jgi:flagellar hook-basal body complex protein FliE